MIDIRTITQIYNTDRAHKFASEKIFFCFFAENDTIVLKFSHIAFA